MAITPSDYPLYSKYYVLTIDKFDELIKKHKPRIVTRVPKKMKHKKSIVKYNNSYVLIRENWSDNEELNNATDFFSEIVRIQCNFKGHVSPFDYWKANHNTLTNKFKNMQINEIRDFMYNNAKFCNNFRVSVALTIYKLFNAKKILDPSAGWGDRLIAAIGNDTEMYTGVDPNNDMWDCYDNIIKTLARRNDQRKYNIIHDGFEYANIDKNTYDLVFTSPPFFDLEEYSKSPKDSYNANKHPDAWYNNFLVALIKKSYDSLIYGGHFALYISESTDTNYVGKMVEFTNKLMKSNGSIYYYYEGSYIPRRIYVWKKVNYL